MQSAVVEKVGRQEWEGAGHGAAAVRKQRKCCRPASVLLSSAQEPRLHDDRAQDGSSLLCQTCLETLSKTHGRRISMVILNPRTLAIKTKHCRERVFKGTRKPLPQRDPPLFLGTLE